MPDFSRYKICSSNRVALLLLLAACLIALAGGHAQAQDSGGTSVARLALLPAPPQLAASSYLLLDAHTGKVIVEQGADQQLPPASLTKIMTAYIVSSELEKGSITHDDMVPISVKAWKMGGSRMFVREGTQVRLEDLLRGVIVQSGNDASVALAEYIAGDEQAFAMLMNQQAALLGMRYSNFLNATGWPAEGHLTTARDMAALARALVRNFPAHYKIYAEKEFSYNGITQANRNGLLWRDQSVDGIKTGHTEEAGFCLVASAKRDDMRLVSVVMGAKSARAREQETQKLLAYGFRYYQTHTLYTAGEEISSSKVWAGKAKTFPLVLSEDLSVTIPRGQRDALQAKIAVDKEVVAPVEEGTVYGQLNLVLGGELIAQRDLVAGAGVEQAGFFARLWDQIILFVRGILGLSD
ncbi:MAG: D-alanyl-D-alanine carboxypeptidase [Gammaproteobacteria bacterium]|nr:D-alanyl-D-alanine carboxypeptidase [Gammaproteobacteria bacterium]NNM11697.1 D-alanyl-D-alanine carboxypeptidase [Pseudomonadales bacterium]RZV51422.1 MAG: D-alanyl-D-alanine carboxypeptidase [Pseudomonadales bacterium]